MDHTDISMERERERERERETETDRQTDIGRWPDRHTHRGKERDRDRQRETVREIVNVAKHLSMDDKTNSLVPLFSWKLVTALELWRRLREKHPPQGPSA